jgi:hypothetical protein
MTNRNNNTKENKMIDKLEALGAVDVAVNGKCWSMTLPTGKKWAGGIGAVRILIDHDLKLIPTRRATVRLESDALGKTWTTQNGG